MSLSELEGECEWCERMSVLWRCQIWIGTVCVLGIVCKFGSRGGSEYRGLNRDVICDACVTKELGNVGVMIIGGSYSV